MSDPGQWCVLWRREPKLRPDNLTWSIIQQDRPPQWCTKVPEGQCPESTAEALIRDAAVRWLLCRADTRWLSLDMDEGRDNVFLECHLMSTEDFVTDPGYTLIDALYATCSRLLDEREAAAASRTSQEPTP